MMMMMMMMRLIIVAALMIAVTPAVVVSAKKILWVTQSGHSPAHQMVTVANAWLSTHPEHEMTFLAYNDEKSLIASKDSNIEFQSFGAPAALAHPFESARRMQENSLDGIAYMLELYLEPYDQEVQALDNIMKNNDEKPDMVIVDVFTTSALDYLAFHDDVPYIVFYHCIALGILGMEDNLAFPDAIAGTSKHQLGFWDRLKRIRNLIQLIVQTSDVTAKYNQKRKQHGFPTYDAPNTHIVGRPILVPTSFAFEYARSLSPLVHFAGFITAGDNNTAADNDDDDDITAWLDQQQQDVVYAAFGTIMILTPEFLTKLIQGVVASDSQLLLAARPKALSDEVNIERLLLNLDAHKHVKHAAWVKNQQAMLDHVAIKVFVTHGGASSIAEAVKAHVPMLVIPSGSDRYANAARLVDMAYCVSLHHKSFTPAQVTQGIAALAGNQTIIRRLEWMQNVNDFTGGGAPGAAQWMQHILDNGYEHLVPLEQTMGFVAANNVDIILVVVVAMHLLLFVTYKVLSRCCAGTRKGKQKYE